VPPSAPGAPRFARGVGYAALGCLVAVAGIDCWRALAHPLLQGDSADLVNGAGTAVDCLRWHRFTNCQGLAALRSAGRAQQIPSIGPWPVLQYIPAIALRAAGVPSNATLRVLIALNAAALVTLGTCVYATARRVAGALWSPVLAVAVITSPLLWYGTVAFGEALAAAVVVTAVAAALLRARPPLIGALVALACLTKETNPAFVFVLTAICIIAVTDTRHEKRRRLVAVGVGTALGVAANAGFNVFRFGTIRNTIYLQGYERVPNSAVAARAFAALWVAPNGGIVWFSPVAIGLLALVTVAALRHIRTSPRGRRFATAAVAALFVVQVAALSTWYSPFGWDTWGPRLLLPLLPAMVLAAVALGAGDATSTLVRLLTSRAFWPIVVATVLAGLPQAAVLYHPHTLAEFFADPRCRGAHINSAPARYYRCFDYLAWSKRPLILRDGLEGLSSTGGRVFAFVFAAAVVSLLLAARLRAQTIATGPSEGLESITPASGQA
jgi:hypothetical protein